jgi:DNA helicase IV
MVKVLAKAIRTRQRPLRRDMEVPFGASVLRLRAEVTEDIVAAARRRPGPHNSRRRFVEAQVVRALSDDYRSRLARDETTSPDEVPSQEEQNDLSQRLRRVPEVAEALERMWPRLSPHEFLHDLLGARPLLAAAAKGILDPSDVRRLYRPRGASLDAVAWTVADTALIDEARTLLGPRRGVRHIRARVHRTDEAIAQEVAFWPQGLAPSPAPVATSVANGSDEEVRTFGHIVVDEVQDLSPMQLRMLARRSLSGSMTVVGDIAQATGPWAPRDWDDVTRHLSPQRPPRLVELTVSYRTPAEVVALAAKVLAVATPAVTPPRPVRRSGCTPLVVETARGVLATRVTELAREEIASVSPGTVAVLGPAVMLPELIRALDDAGLDPVDPRDPSGAGLSAGLVVLPADETNGLEFDSVIVVEPALIAAVGDDGGSEGPPVPTTRGLRTLYVAMTRPTKRLSLVHADPLPVDLD